MPKATGSGPTVTRGLAERAAESARTRLIPNLGIAVPWLLTIGTASIGIMEFSVQQTQSNRQPFLERQMDLVFEASDLAATLATTRDPKVFDTSAAAFRKLYAGPLIMVEDRCFAMKMADFSKQLHQQGAETFPLPRKDLTIASTSIARTGRQLIANSWGVELPELVPGSEAPVKKRGGWFQASGDQTTTDCLP